MCGLNALRRQMLFAARNRHRERAADANGALHPHTAAVQFHQFLNQRQSDPCAFVGPGLGALDAVKALEHLLEMLLGYSHACVADLQFHCAVYEASM